MFSCWYTPLWNDVNGPKNGLNLPHCWGCFLDGERSIQLKGMVFVSIHVHDFPEFSMIFEDFPGWKLPTFCWIKRPVVVWIVLLWWILVTRRSRTPNTCKSCGRDPWFYPYSIFFGVLKKMGVDDDLQRTGYKWCVLKAKRIEGPCDVPISSCLFHCPGWLAEHHNRNGWAPSRRSGSDRSHGRTPSSTRPNCQAGDESLGQPHQDEQTNTSPSFVGEVGKALLHFS